MRRILALVVSLAVFCGCPSPGEDCAAKCANPPTTTCVDDETLRTYSTPDSCVGGCEYPFTDTACAEGCSNGACGGSGACSGLVCKSPPAKQCADSGHLRVYSSPGTCGDGLCSYASSLVTCEQGCADDACIGNPCAGVLCQQPPAATCADAHTLRTFGSPGTCSGGDCSYTSKLVPCAGGCANGACLGDPCAGITCDQPPASTCADADTLRTYASRGTCSAGGCSYSETTTPCPVGCQNGACLPATCEKGCPPGFSCDAKGRCAGGPLEGLALDVPTVNVSGEVKHGGAKILNTKCSFGSYVVYLSSVAFRDLATNQTTTMTISCDTTSGWTFSGVLYPGSYEVSLSPVQGEFPNTPYVAISRLDLTTDKSGIVLDVPTVNVSGEVKHGGAKILNTRCSVGSSVVYLSSVAFRNLANDQTTSLTVSCDATSGWTFSGVVYPGTYEVSLSPVQGEFPGTSFVAIAQLDATSNKSGIVLDVPTVAVSGEVKRNGAKILNTRCSVGSYVVYVSSVAFRNLSTDQTTTLTLSCDATSGWTFSGVLYPGSYEVSLSPVQGEFPGTSYVAIAKLDAVTDQSGIVLDVRTVNVSGAVKHNGAPILNTRCSSGSYYVYVSSVAFRNLATDRTTTLTVSCDATSGWTFSGVLYPGSYAVSLSPVEGEFPDSSFPAIAALDATVDKSGIVLDVPTVNVSGEVHRNGVRMLDTNCTRTSSSVTYLSAVVFRNLATNASTNLDIACDASSGWTFSGLLYPGSYEVQVAPAEGAFPDTSYLVIAKLELDADRSGLVLDVVAPEVAKVPVAGEITRNGMHLLDTGCTVGSYYVYVSTVTFRNLDTEKTTSLQVTCDATAGWTFEGSVLPGTYEVSVSLQGRFPNTSYVVIPRLRVP